MSSPSHLIPSLPPSYSSVLAHTVPCRPICLILLIANLVPSHLGILVHAVQFVVALRDLGLVLHLLANLVVQCELALGVRRLIVAADYCVPLSAEKN